jgi:hypothetical protein
MSDTDMHLITGLSHPATPRLGMFGLHGGKRVTIAPRRSEPFVNHARKSRAPVRVRGFFFPNL